MSIARYLPIDDKIWFYLVVMAVLEALAVYLWKFRKMPGVIPQVINQACKGAWLLFLVLLNISTEISYKLLWVNLLQIATILVSYIWFVFVVQISGQEKKISLSIHYALRSVIIILCIIALSSGWHDWYWQKVWLEDQTLVCIVGVAAWFSLIFCYFLNFVNLLLGIRWVFTTVGLRRQQALALTVITPLIGWAGHLAGIIQGASAIDRPLSFLAAGLFLTWSYRRWLIYNILPQAQKAVIRTMIDGLLIVDKQNYIADINPAAKIIFQDIPIAIGSKYQEVLAAWPALNLLEGINDGKEVEAIREFSEGRQYYQLRLIPLQNEQRFLLGKIIIITNITSQKQNQEKLMEQQKALSILTERDRLGRELHDDSGQIWNYFYLELQSIGLLMNKGQIEKSMEQVSKLAKVALDLNTDVRDSIVSLKQTAATKDDFYAKLQEYLGWYEKSYGIVTCLVLPKGQIASLFNRSSEVQLVRIIQEALTNIRKHAKAQQVEITIKQQAEQIIVQIADDGCGFDVETVLVNCKGYGLQIMKERAEEVGGKFQIDTKPGSGTLLTVQFSLSAPVI